jgi:hypothetical protein
MICTKCRSQCVKTDWAPPRGINPDLRQYSCSNCGDEFYAESRALDEQPASATKRPRDPGSRPMTVAQISSLFLFKG